MIGKADQAAGFCYLLLQLRRSFHREDQVRCRKTADRRDQVSSFKDLAVLDFDGPAIGGVVVLRRDYAPRD
jgi:hypothetical protein